MIQAGFNIDNKIIDFKMRIYVKKKFDDWKYYINSVGRDFG